MSLFGPTTVTCILGMRGCGKTYLSREIQKLYPRCVIIDLTGEYSEEGPYHTEGDINCYTFEEYTHALQNSLKQERFRIIFHSHMDSHDDGEIIEHCIRLALVRSSAPEASYNNILLVLEEVQNYSSAHNLPHYQKYNFLVGRHHGAATLVTSQRPAEVHKTILSQAEIVFCGACSDPNDIKYLSSRFGKEAETLSSLQRAEFLMHRHGEICKRVKNTLV